MLASLGVDALSRRSALPRVTLLLLLGVGVGPAGLGLITGEEPWLGAAGDVALFMIGFLLGEKLRPRQRRGHGVAVAAYSIAVATSGVVAGGLWALGVGLPTALVVGGVAAATDPAATVEVIREQQADGPFSRTLLGVVAVDDVWGVIVFSVLFAIAQAVTGASAVAALVTGAAKPDAPSERIIDAPTGPRSPHVAYVGRDPPAQCGR